MTEKKVASLEREKARLERRLAQEQARQERERARQEVENAWQQAKSRLLQEMTRHIGKARAIGAGELFEIVFQQPYEGNKITGCRLLRKMIEAVKYGDNPTLIAHSCCNIRPGYYIPVGSEEREYRERESRKVKAKIGRLARLFRVNESAYAGQLALEMREGSSQ